MKIIHITDNIISWAVNRLNRITGGEHDITLGRDGMDRPYARIRDLVSGAVNAMSDRYEYDADEVAEFLGIDGEAFAWYFRTVRRIQWNPKRQTSKKGGTLARIEDNAV